MVWVNFIIKLLIILVIINFSNLKTLVKTGTFPRVNVYFALYFPIALAVILTILDTLSLFFLYQLIILFVLGIFGYGFFKYLNSKAKR